MTQQKFTENGQEKRILEVGELTSLYGIMTNFKFRHVFGVHKLIEELKEELESAGDTPSLLHVKKQYYALGKRIETLGTIAGILWEDNLQRAFTRTVAKSRLAVSKVPKVSKPDAIALRELKVLQGACHVLIEAFKDDCEKNIFLVLDNADADSFSNETPFGQEVFDAFEDFREDICNASKCIALEQYDAVVFYLMRIMEATVRKVGIMLDVKPLKKGVEMPMEDAGWEHILTLIQNQIRASSKQPSDREGIIVSPLIEAEPDEYQSLIIQLTGVRKVWRNPIMHPVSDPILEGEAKDIFRAVGLYLKSLIPILTNPSI